MKVALVDTLKLLGCFVDAGVRVHPALLLGDHGRPICSHCNNRFR
jgi:hypothetical protein